MAFFDRTRRNIFALIKAITTAEILLKVFRHVAFVITAALLTYKIFVNDSTRILNICLLAIALFLEVFDIVMYIRTATEDKQERKALKRTQKKVVGIFAWIKLVVRLLVFGVTIYEFTTEAFDLLTFISTVVMVAAWIIELVFRVTVKLFSALIRKLERDLCEDWEEIKESPNSFMKNVVGHDGGEDDRSGILGVIGNLRDRFRKTKSADDNQ